MGVHRQAQAHGILLWGDDMVLAHDMKMAGGRGLLGDGRVPRVRDMVLARDMILVHGTLVQGGTGRAHGNLMADDKGLGSCKGPEHNVQGLHRDLKYTNGVFVHIRLHCFPYIPVPRIPGQIRSLRWRNLSYVRRKRD